MRHLISVRLRPDGPGDCLANDSDTLKNDVIAKLRSQYLYKRTPRPVGDFYYPDCRDCLPRYSPAR